MKLEKLNKEQENFIPVVRDEWIKFCLGGDSGINRQIAMEGIRWIYGLSKLKSPFVIFVDGPYQCQMAVWFLKAWLKNGKFNQVWDQVRAQVRAQVWAQVRDQVGDQVMDQVGAQVGDQVRDQVGDQVWDQVGAQVGDQVGDQVGAQVRAQVRGQKREFSDYAWRDLGNDSGWVAWFDFYDRIGIKITDNARKYRDYVKSGIFMTIFLEGFAIACPRPTVVKRNERNRLHSGTGPAVEWKNEKYWFWNGTRVTEKIIMRPNELTKDEITKENNSEVSRAIAEKLGWDEYLKRIDTVLIDKWFDCSTSCHYELYDFKERRFSLMPRLLKMESPELKDGTRPYYIEPVHPQLKTCQAARKWQFSKPDLSWPSVEECNKSPKLVFESEA